MGGKTAIAAGLVTGLLTGAVVVGGVVLLAPRSAPEVPAAPTPVAEASPTPTASPSASPSSTAGSSSPSASGSPVAGEALAIGSPAPPLSVPQLGGGRVSLASLQGSPVWLTFVAGSCPACRDVLPVMNELATRYAVTGLVAIAIDVGDDEAAADALARELKVTIPVGLDRDGAARAAWHAPELPVHYWIDADGIVRDAASGAIGPEVMARGMESILPGVDVTP